MIAADQVLLLIHFLRLIAADQVVVWMVCEIPFLHGSEGQVISKHSKMDSKFQPTKKHSKIDTQQQVVQSKKVPGMALHFFRGNDDWLKWQRAFASASRGLGIPHILLTRSAKKKTTPREDQVKAQSWLPPTLEGTKPRPIVEKGQLTKDFQQSEENWQRDTNQIELRNIERMSKHAREYRAMVNSQPSGPPVKKNEEYVINLTGPTLKDEEGKFLPEEEQHYE